MFGTYSAIMDENPNFFLDYQEIQDPKDRWVNRICPDGNWESNLFQFYSRVLPILQNHLYWKATNEKQKHQLIYR